MTAVPHPDLVAKAFNLGRRVGEPVPAGKATTYRLDTTGGRFLVKRVRPDWPEWWHAEAASGMRFEGRARSAGVDMPWPVEPAEPALGYAARIDADGPIRVYEWMDGRPLEPHDDIAAWLGRTLAILNGLEPAGRPHPNAYGLHPLADWERWFQDAVSLRLPFGHAGRRSLPLIAEAGAFVEESLDLADDFVVTHRDVEPWNILVAERGPVLVDWDWIGADSAWFVAAYAAVAYGRVGSDQEPNPGRVRRVVEAYVHHGGHVACGPPRSLTRRVGLRLLRLAFSVWVALGHRHHTQAEREESAVFALGQMAKLPLLMDEVHGWSRLVS